jgi:imidazolonepropionase-like amidohydrolase
MRTRYLKPLTIVTALAAFGLAGRAEAPHIYAIRGARIVTAAGAPIASGTIVIRDGVIEAVGADVAIPPEARVIDASGLTAYPGLIDMGTTTGLDVPTSTAPQNPRTTEEIERYKRSTILRPHLEAADHVRPDAPELNAYAAAGITSVLAVPPGSIVKGQSALLNVAFPEDEPQIGAPADVRTGLNVVKPHVALHVDFGGRGGGGGYPQSLMGVIAFVRQSFLDAQHYRLVQQRWERVKSGEGRPQYDPALEALQPALDRRLPVAFESGQAREILRSLKMASEFKLDPVITGAREADQVVADLKAANARVVYNLNFPTRPRTLAPDADEPLETLRDRADAPKTPAALEKAGILFAFESSGLRDQKDFVRNVAKAVKEGLSPDAAVRALTINAARIAGAADRVGSLEKGKIANVLLTDGDLFDEKMRIRHLFVDGRLVKIEEAPAGGGRGRGRGRGGN